MNKYKLILSRFTLSIAVFTLLIGCSASFIEAVKDGNIDVVEEKINANSEDVNLSDGIFFACRDGNLEMANLLLNNGADPNDNNNEFSPLYLAAYNGHLDVVKYLIEKGADVNKVCNSKARVIKDNEVQEKEGTFYYQFVKANKGETALSAAVSKGDISIVKTLLENGANPNTSVIWKEAHHNCGGGYAAEGFSLKSAISIEGVLRTVNIDREGNTDSNIRPSFEKRFTVLQLSKELGFDDITELLISYGAVD